MINNNIKSTNFKEECLLYMSEVGLPFEGQFIVDGRIHRYSSDSKKNKPDEYYVAYEGSTSYGNYYFGCKFGSWSDGSQYEYKSFDQQTKYNEAEIKELREKAKTQRLEAEKELRLLHDNTAKKAQSLWSSYGEIAPNDEYFSYIKLKGINKIIGIRFGLNPQGYPSIIIPIQSIKGEIRSLQYISVDVNGKSYKTFLEGGEKKGNFYILGKVTDSEENIFIVEGFATGVSVYEAINKPVIVAFDAGNLEKVVENIKNKFPKISIILAGDSDEIGIKKASYVADKFGCNKIFPVFPKEYNPNDYKDFNDLHKICGLIEVRKQLLQDISNRNEELTKIANSYLVSREEPCAKFKLLSLPDQLREYIAMICKSTNAHPIMVTASVLTMVSAFLGNKIYIPEGEYFQDLYGNLWILCVARSGQFKSTALIKGGKLAFDKQIEVFREIKNMQYDVQSEELAKKILIKSCENVVLPTKITSEAFLEHLAQGHQGAIYASEFGGWLQNLDKNHNNDFKAILTEFYDVPSYYRYKTKTQGDCIIEMPYISICGVSTMHWIKSNLKTTDVPSGFFARFLIFVPPYQEEIPPALPTKLDEYYFSEENKFRITLNKILKDIGQGKKYYLKDSAREVFESFHKEIYIIPKIYTSRAEEILQPYLKRWSPYLLKLAMIIQLFIDSETNEISEAALISALSLLLPAIKSTASLFEGELGESEHQRKCRVIFEWICHKTKETGKPIKRHTIISSKKLDGGIKDYDYVLQTLMDQGKIGYKEFSKKNESEYFLIETIENN